MYGDILLKRNETRKMTSSIEETLRLIQLTLEKVMQTCENVEKCTLIIYLAAHIYIVAVLHSLFISHILVFLVLIIQHIVPKIYTLVNSNPRIPFVTQESLFVNENPVL